VVNGEIAVSREAGHIKICVHGLSLPEIAMPK
jgi:hypothetical protein